MNEPFFITRRQASILLRQATGLAVRRCRIEVNQLPTYTDGKREKITRTALASLIKRINQEPQRRVVSIRPISAKNLARGYAGALRG